MLAREHDEWISLSKIIDEDEAMYKEFQDCLQKFNARGELVGGKFERGVEARMSELAAGKIFWLKTDSLSAAALQCTYKQMSKVFQALHREFYNYEYASPQEVYRSPLSTDLYAEAHRMNRILGDARSQWWTEHFKQKDNQDER